MGTVLQKDKEMGTVLQKLQKTKRGDSPVKIANKGQSPQIYNISVIP